MQPGDVVDDRFVALELAGAGGMGTVYRATDRRTDEQVALKVLRARTAAAARRFEREASVLAELDHPALVRYVAHGTTDAGEQYLAMEWLEGEDVARTLERRRMDRDEAVALALRAADALGVAHARGVVHRDVKPANLFLVGGDVAGLKVVDFGIARRADALTATQTGMMLGTPAYMAPEQARGAREVDARADSFSLACVLFECLTSRAAFVGDTALAVLAKILMDEPPRLRSLCSDAPPTLDAFLVRALSKDPSVRPNDGHAFRAELVAAMATPRPTATQHSTPSVSPRESRVVSAVLVRSGADHGSVPNGSDSTVDARTMLDPRGNAAATVERCGARVEPLLSWGWVVVVSEGATPAEQAAHAARCALAIQAELPAARVAMATGRATIGDERGPIGAVIDRVAAMQARGLDRSMRAGAVAVDETVAALLEDDFELAHSPEGASLRGERAPDSSRRFLGRPTRLLGRERELTTLRTLWDEAVAEPVARAVVVTGAPGLGKSRLAHELLSEIEVDAVASVWRARCNPSSAGATFGVLGTLARAALPGLGSAPDERRERLITQTRASLAPDAVAHGLGELLGSPYDENAGTRLAAGRRDPLLMNDLISEAWVWLLGYCLARGPVGIFLEDLHWADAPSVAALDRMLAVHREAPLFVLATARTQIHARFPALWRARHAQEITLSGLTRRASERLVRDALGETADGAVLERWFSQSEGNPFVLEELVRAAAAGRPTELPETVLALVQGRIAALSDRARLVLRAASILGETFDRDALASLVGGDDIGVVLEELEQHELVEGRAGVADGLRSMTFRHALVHDAAYETLVAEDRTRGHLAAGQWLERTATTDPQSLALHFDLGGDAARAAHWYHATARAALAGNDLPAVMAASTQALRLAGDDSPLAPSLHVLHAIAQKWRGEWTAAIDSTTRAMRGGAVGSDAWWDALGEQALVCGSRQQSAPLRDLWAAAETANADSPPALMACARLCIALWQVGDTEGGQASLSRVEEVDARLSAHGSEDVVAAARVHLARGMSAIARGDWWTFLQRSRAARDLFEAFGDKRSAIFQRLHEAEALAEMGRHADAGSVTEEVLATCERLEMKRVAVPTRQLIADLARRRGDLEVAWQLSGDSDDGSTGGSTMPALIRASVALARGRYADVEGTVMPVLSAGAPHAAVRARAQSLVALARSACGEHETARQLADEAWRNIEAERFHRGFRPVIGLARALVLEAAGSGDGATRAIAAARDRLLEQAAEIPDEAFRASFLRGIPEHAEILERAAR